MSQLSNRPVAGNFVMNRTLVRHTPDAMVYINGHSELASCAMCNKSLDLQQYITSVSADGTTESIATANLTLNIPQHAAESLGVDGNFLLQTALEVVILMRGYFPMKGYAGTGQEPGADGFDANAVPVYPYYQVFRGVVTNVTHAYSGGFYTVTMQCANLLHFWQTLKISPNGAIFGPRPNNSLVEPSILGHKFSRVNPYSIIYTLVKVGFGAAFGVESGLQFATNITAKSDSPNGGAFAHAAQWWEQRWTEHSGNLRMYGISGTVYSAFEQAYLGRWADIEEGSVAQVTKIAKVLDAGKSKDFDLNYSKDFLEKAKELAYDPYLTSAAVYTNADGKDRATEEVMKMQAFAFDITKIANFTNFETEYVSKLDIAEEVKKITGFEFYQDVDGDLVFKPPMYNLDTRSDPVYCIEDRDLISIDETETEPDATMVKGTGAQLGQNIQGMGLETFLGNMALFIDYKLVAKYGWKEETFESVYLSSPHALFISAMNRLDLANVGVKSASISIPLRPELRPGFPIYVRHLDCFYYVKSFSHSFSFGGECTTSIQGVAKRAKWLPPMDIPTDGKFPSIKDVRLDAPGEFPRSPLYGYPSRMVWDPAEVVTETDEPPRAYGFPNVVMAMDPDKVHYDTVDLGGIALPLSAYLQMGLKWGFLQRNPEDPENSFLIQTSNETSTSVSLADFQQKWTSVSEALKEGKTPDLSSDLGKLITNVQQRIASADTADAAGLVNYLALQTNLKAAFAPGSGIQGDYRYYSCSHPDPIHQAPKNLVADHGTGNLGPADSGEPEFTKEYVVFKDIGGGKGVGLEKQSLTRGFVVAGFRKQAPENQPVNPLPAGVGRITSKFGEREPPTEGASTNHKGTDIAAAFGTPVYSSYAGTVTTASGSTVSVTSEGNRVVTYLHLSKIVVTVGQSIKAGGQVGEVGGTADGAQGVSTGPHLHVEETVDGVFQDSAYLLGGGVPATTTATAVVASCDIRYVTMGPQVTVKNQSVTVTSDGSKSMAAFKMASKTTQTNFAKLLRRTCESDASLTITKRFETEYERLELAARGFAASTGQSGPSIATAIAKAESVTAAMDAFSGKTGLGEKTLSEAYPKKTEDSALSQVAGVLSKALWTYVDSIMTTARASEKAGTAKAGDLVQAIFDFYVNYGNGDTELNLPPPPAEKKPSDSWTEAKASWTPIFPVSDAGGYEVYGNLPYGRGVDIETYADLTQVQTTGETTSSGLTAAQSSVAQVGTRGGSNASSLELIERFMITYILLGGKSAPEAASQALSKLPSEEQAALYAALNVPSGTDVDAVIASLSMDSSSRKSKVRNSPVTSFFRGMAVFGDSAAEGLADLTVGGNTCTCKGGDAKFLLHAFSEKYLQLYPTDPVTGSQQEEAWNKAAGWDQSRKAMAGQGLDTRSTNLVDQFTDKGDISRTYTNLAETSVNAVSSAVTAAQTAGDAVNQSTKK